MVVPIAIFGTGGFGREVHELVRDINREQHRFDVIGFLDGNTALHGKEVHEVPVLGDVDWIRENPGVGLVIAVGSPSLKRRVRQAAKSVGVQFPNLVSPRAWVGTGVTLGQGVIVCAQSAVTTDIVIGDFVTLNLAVTVGHDSRIEDFVTISPGTNISGNVHLHEGVELGTNVGIIPGVTVGEWTVIGAGAVVTRDLPSNVTAVGAPAKVIKERERGWHL